MLFRVVNGRYSTVLKGKPTVPMSVVERAVDAHIIHVINAPNFQRCITAIWRGHIQIYYYPDNTLATTPYRHLTSTAFWDHFDTRRMRGITFLDRLIYVSPLVSELA